MLELRDYDLKVAESELDHLGSRKAQLEARKHKIILKYVKYYDVYIVVAGNLLFDLKSLLF